MNSDLIKVRKELEERKLTTVVMLANGAAKDYAEYKQMVGRISGLNLAITDINDLLEKKRTDDG